MRVGAVAPKRGAKAGEQSFAKLLRLLPENYSRYNALEQRCLEARDHVAPKMDVICDRRLGH